MSDYQYTNDAQTIVRHIPTGTCIPIRDMRNRNRQQLQCWLDAGNTILPAEPEPPEPPEETRRRDKLTELIQSVNGVRLADLNAAHIRTIVIILLARFRCVGLDEQGHLVVRVRQQ